MNSHASLAAALVLASACNLAAVTIPASTWSGATSGDTNVGTNWVGNAVPVSGTGNNSLIFGPSVFGTAAQTNITLSASFETSGITFTSAAPNYVFGASNGATLGIGSGGITLNGTVGNKIVSSSSLPLQLQASQTWSTGNSGGKLSVSGNVSGAGTLTLSGGGSVMLAGTDTNTGGITVTGGTNVFFLTNASIPASGNITSSSTSNYVGVGQDGGMTQLLGRIVSPASVRGTLGFDTDPAAASPTVFHDPIDLTSFTNTNFAGLGTFSSATLTGNITVANNHDYKFGGGGGTLYVASNLVAAGNGGVTLTSPGTDESQHLKVVLQGTNTFTGAVDVTIAGVVFDSPGALPTGVNFALHDDAYAGYTENATGFANFAAFKSRLASGFDSDAIIGIDSSTAAGRTVSDAIDLHGLGPIFLGTATKVTLTGAITAPTGGTLYLTGVDGGYLKIASPLSASGNVTSVNLGFSENETGVADNDVTYHGIVELTGASTYTGNTTLDSGYLLLGASTSGTSGNITSGPLGKGTLVVPGDSDTPVLAASANVTVANNLSITTPGLQIGIPATTSSSDLASSLQGLRGYNLTLTGGISGTGTIDYEGAGTLTLAGTNTYTGNTTVNAGTVQFAKKASLYNGVTANWTATKLTVAPGATAAFNVGGTGEFAAADVDILKSLGTGTGGFRSGSTLGLDTGNASGGSFTYGSAIANPNGGANALGLAKLGAGTLILTDASTYTGGTTISAGTLQIGAGGAAGSIAGNVLNNAELAFSRSDAISFGGVISGSGNLTLQGGGNFTLTGLNTYSGTTTIIQGSTLTAAAANTLPAATQVAVAFGTLAVNAPQTIAGLSGSNTGSISIAGSQALTLNNAANNSFGGLISGAGAFVKNGAGTLTLTNANTYSGGTTVNAGNLILNNTGSSGTGPGNVAVGSGATLTVSPGNAAGSVSGNIANSGAVVYGRTDDTTYTGVISGTGTFEKKGPGNLTLTGANTYGGTTTLSAGTLTIGATNALPTSTQISLALGSILNVAHDQTIAGFTGADGSGASILLDLGKTLTVAMPVASTSTTFAGSVSGDGIFAVSGAGNDIVNLTGSVTNSGGTVVGAGASLNIVNGGSVSGPITTNGILNFGSSGSQTVSNVISGTGGLSASAGTTTLTAPNLYSGPTVIAGGKLIVSNTSGSATGTGTVTVGSGGILGGSGFISGPLVLTAGGTVSPGNSPGNLSVGPTTFAGGAMFTFDINDAQGSPGTNWDLLSISGSLTIAATNASPFVINLVSLDSANNAGLTQNFNPAQSYTWQFVTSTGIAGFPAPDVFSFDSSRFQNSLTGGSFGVSQVGNSLFVNFTPVPEPSTWALLSVGAAALAAGAWRRRRLK